MSILDISKTLMFEFWYDYAEPKYKDKAKLCYIDTDLLLTFLLKTFLKTLTMMLKERWFDTSDYDQNDKRLLPMRVNKKSNWDA